MTRRAVAVLGIGQCVAWGVLYYAFAVFVLPVQHDLGVATWIVTGAYSMALLISAAAAPTVGRWADAGRGAMLMQTGGFVAAGLLCVWALLPSLATLYVVWAGLGLCMAMALYEPAFVIVGQTHDEPSQRLRALATVTVFGGLASTVFLPTAAFLVEALGWRRTIVALAVGLAASTCVTRVLVFRRLPARAPSSPPIVSTPGGLATADTPPGFALVLVMFSVASSAAAAFMANVVPALSERDVSPAMAATLGGSLGVMQVPGRALLMRGVFPAAPVRLITLSLLLQGVGFIGLAVMPSRALLAAAVMVFSAGAGLTTLARPHVVQAMFSVDNAGYLNGRLARWQQLARAAGPILVAWLAGAASYAAVFFVLGATFVVLAPVFERALKGAHQARTLSAAR